MMLDQNMLGEVLYLFLVYITLQEREGFILCIEVQKIWKLVLCFWGFESIPWAQRSEPPDQGTLFRTIIFPEVIFFF